MTTLNVTASRWSGGWELEISPHDHTQVRHLSKARQQVLDYLDTMYENEDHTDWVIHIIPELDSLATTLREAKEATAHAAHIQEQAAEKTRNTVRTLLQAGYSQADVAVFLDISRARISQLIKA
ncbi:antitoxin HicB [Arcanobacterium haemolyticum]